MARTLIRTLSGLHGATVKVYRDTDWDEFQAVIPGEPEVLAADTVFVVEGEKDADNLAALGLVATCNTGGASAMRARMLRAIMVFSPGAAGARSAL